MPVVSPTARPEPDRPVEAAPAFSRLTGEFRDRAAENEYRLWRYEALLLQYKIIGWLLVAAAVPFIWTIYRIFGETTEFGLLLAFRLVVVAAAAWALWLAYRRAHYRRLDLSAFIAGALVLSCNAAVMYLNDVIGALMLVQALMITTVCYVIYPGRLVLIAPALLLFSGCFVAAVMTKSALSVTEIPGVVVWTTIANIVGFLGARQFNRFRRNEFASIRQSARQNRDLDAARHTAELAMLEAEKANRAKSAMLANTSHELRTPLNAIIGFSEMLQREMLGPLGDSRYRAYADDIHNSGRHLLALIDDLLDLSKIEAGKAEMRPVWTDVGHALQETVRLERRRAETAGVRVSLGAGPDLASVFVDERAFRQILINLIGNAIKFSPPAAEVDLIAETRPDGSAMLQILDRGPGLPLHEIERLKQPFQQMDHDPSRPREGWGLGLALVSRLSDLNGIGFELGNREGGGAVAVLTVPPAQVRRAGDSPQDLKMVAGI